MKKLLILLLASMPLFANAQDVKVALEPPPPPARVPENPKSDKKYDADYVYDVAEVMPRFRGDINRWMAEHLNYPSVALENGVQGRVIVSFIVDKDGKIRNAKIARGVDPSLDREALRIINSMPAWIPGTSNGKPVNVRIRQDVTFKCT